MEKKVLSTLEKCYSIAPLSYKGRQHILVAAEKKDRCIMFDADGNEEQTVWEGPGGVMTMVQVPDTDGQFLATHKFYSPNDSKEAKIVLAFPKEDGEFEIRTLAELPFVHRFDILKTKNENYLIACTLKSDHEYKDDWRTPGKVYAAKLPENLVEFTEDNTLELEVIKEDMLRNHGYCKVVEDGKESSLICSENGVFRFYPPQDDSENWIIEKLLDEPSSDAVLIDLDGDNEKELVVLSPFHGDQISIYKREKGIFEKVYDYFEKTEFLHAIWACSLKGKPTVILGNRKGKRQLMALTWSKDENQYKFEILDEDCGPANAFKYDYNSKEMVIATNREINEIAMYIFE